MAISYAKFKRTFGDLGITEWVKFNWLSNAGIARNIYNKVVETGYNPLAYVNNELYNRIEGEKFLILVGSLDLGTLNYQYTSGGQGRFVSNAISDIKKPSANNITANLLCFRFTNGSASEVYQGQVGIACSIDGELWFYAPEYSGNITTFKEAMSGVMLYYELATPILIDL